MKKELEFIFKRRSIRKFTAAKVDSLAVREMLEAAMAAPSACAKDPCRFIVLDDPAVKSAITEFLPNGQFLKEAPVGILVLGDLNAAHANSESYLLQDCSAAIENLLLAAEAQGLGACWLGVHPRQERIDGIRAYFQLPENILPVAAIAIGHPTEQRESRTRFKSEYVKFNKWN